MLSQFLRCRGPRADLVHYSQGITRQFFCSAPSSANMSFYDLTAKDIKGQDFPFSQLAGKVVLIVNVASKCGFTKQYSGLQALWEANKDKPFVILGFPCDQFGGQEPGSDADISNFCQLNFGVTFPMMSKIEVNGDNTHPVFKYLKSQKKQLMMESIKWNFEKFLVNSKGEVMERYSSMADPQKDIEPAVVKLLGQISA